MTRTALHPVNVQRDEDAALGAAWRRCEEAAPRFWAIRLTRAGRQDEYIAWVSHSLRPGHGGRVTGDTPTQALTALAEALEARRAAE